MHTLKVIVFGCAVLSCVNGGALISPRDGVMGSPTFAATPSFKSHPVRDLIRREVNKTTIPSATPDWHGVKTPNYQHLYEQFTGPLYCGRFGLSVGVYGFYSWLCTLIIIFSTLYSTATKTRNGLSLFLSHLLSLIYFWTMFGLRIGGQATCSNTTTYVENGQVDPRTGEQVGSRSIGSNFVWAWVAANAVASSTSFFCMMSRDIGLQAIFLAILAMLFVPSMLYHSYANFLYIDSGVWREVVAVSVPIAVVFGLMFALSVAEFLESRKKAANSSSVPLLEQPRGSTPVVKAEEEERSPRAVIVLMCIGSLLLFHVWAVGMGFIQLGRTINDPWGASITKDANGRTNLVLNGLAVPLSLSISAFAASG